MDLTCIGGTEANNRNKFKCKRDKHIRAPGIWGIVTGCGEQMGGMMSGTEILTGQDGPNGRSMMQNGMSFYGETRWTKQTERIPPR